MSRRTKNILVGSIAAILISTAAGALAPADAYDWTITENRPSTLHLRAGAAVASDTSVTITVGLAWRNQGQLEQLLRELNASQSRQYEQYLTPEEFDARFAPSPDDVAELTAYLVANGFTVSRVTSDRLLLIAHGTAAAVRSAFSTRLLTYTDGADVYYAPESDPVLPGSLGQRVVSIQGLDNLLRVRPHHQVQPPGMGPRAGGAPYSPADIARAYGFDALYERGLRGTDARESRIAILTAEGFAPEDLVEFWTSFRVDRTLDSVEIVPVGGLQEKINDETTLDVQWASSMAPGSPLIVYQASNDSLAIFIEMYHRAVEENRAGVLSTSWGVCEDYVPQRYIDLAHAIFQKAAALGITVVAASGDDGAHCMPNEASVDFPASHPLVTAVGGTSLTTDAGGTYGREAAWSGSGSGLSRVWKQSLWQESATAGRAVADVALNADPATGYYVRYGGDWWQYGGTSVGAPVWAALLALANQHRAQQGLAAVGVPSPRLCEAFARDPSIFNDIVDGSNQVFAATVGWDHVTGWGTPVADRLVAALGERGSSAGTSGATRLVQVFGNGGRGRGARASFACRCGNGLLDIRVPSAKSSVYELYIDGALTASAEPDAVGRFLIPSVDPRARTILLKRAGAAEPVLAGVFPHGRDPVRSFSESLVLLSREGGRGLVRYRSRGGATSVIVRTWDLPPREYDILIAGEVVGSMPVRARNGRSSGAARFDSRSARGALLLFDPLCAEMRITHKGKTHLRLDALGAASGACAK